MAQNKNDTAGQNYHEVVEQSAKFPNNNDTPLESKFVLANYFYCFLNSTIKTGAKRS